MKITKRIHVRSASEAPPWSRRSGLMTRDVFGYPSDSFGTCRVPTVSSVFSAALERRPGVGDIRDVQRLDLRILADRTQQARGKRPKAQCH